MMLTAFSAQGYGIYRVNTAFMDKVADTYRPVQRKVNKTLKRRPINQAAEDSEKGVTIKPVIRLNPSQA